MCDDSITFQRIANSSNNPKVKTIFKILATGEEELCNSSIPLTEDAILVLGDTEAGRRVFTKWISGKGTAFVSKPDESRLGEYVIFDPEPKTNELSPVPVFVFNPDTNAFFYFPAFANHRDVAYTIATHHFVTKIMDKVNTAKICFLIEHYKMTNSLACQDEFENFLKHIVELIKNLDKLRDNVILVASNVPRALSTKSDDEIIAAMVSFIQNQKETLVRQQNEQNETGNSKVIKFLDLLISKEENNTVYPRLALFRSPDQEGRLSDIPLMQANKERVNDRIQHLNFTQITDDDFQYAMSEISKYDTKAIMEEIRKSIIDDVATNCNKIRQYFEMAENLVSFETLEKDLANVYEQMKSGYEKMLAIRTSAGASDYLKDCLNQIPTGVANMIDNSIKLDLSAALNGIEAWEFLLSATGGQPSEITWCVDGLAEVIQYLDDLTKWYYFEKNLYSRLQSDSINKNMNTFNITDGDVNKKVSETDLKIFSQRNPLEQLYLQFDDIKDIVLTEARLKSVKLIANLSTEYRQAHKLGHGLRGYFDDLYDLEDKFYSLSNRTSYLHHYRLLHARVEKYIEKIPVHNKSTYYRSYMAMNYVQITILSRIQTIENTMDDDMLLTLYNYLNSFLSHIREYNGTLKVVHRRDYRAEFQNTTNTLISEAYAALESIVPEMDKIHDTIDHEIEKLIQTIDESTKEENQEKQKELASQLSLKASVEVLKVTSIASRFWGPIGIVTSSAGGLNDTKIERNITRSILEEVKQFGEWVKNVYLREKRSLWENLSNLDINKIEESSEVIALISKDESFKNVKNSVHHFINLLNNSLLGEQAYWQNKKLIKVQLRQYYVQQLQEHANLQIGRANSEDIEIKKKIALRKWTERIMKMITVTECRVTNFEISMNVISKVGNATEQVYGTIEKLKDYEHNIRVLLIPSIETTETNMVDALQQNSSVRDAHTLFQKNKQIFQNLARDLKKNKNIVISISTTGSPIKQNISAYADTMLYGMNASIRIYNRIQDYEDQTRLAQYLEILRYNDFVNDDPNLRGDIVQFEHQIKYNFALYDYKRAMGTFRQYLFPFGNSFLEQFNITSYFKPHSISDLARTAFQLVSQLRNELNLLSATISQSPDTISRDVRFDFQDVEQKPFFIWHRDTHSEKISNLLQGQEVKLMADLMQIRDMVNVNLNAVKFNEIGIRFLSPNKQEERRLHDVLDRFQVTLTHLGDSHYKCNNESYVFDHIIIRMTHSVNTLHDDENNPTYTRLDAHSSTIKNNPSIFSPYATWNIQLTSNAINPSEKERDFQMLRGFLNQQFDLALEGRGTHVQFPAQSCKNILKKYYKLGGISSPQPSHNYHYNPNAPFETNSANSIKSPINIAAKWLTDTLAYLTPFWGPNTVHHNFIEDNFQSFFSYFKLSPKTCFAKDYTSATATNVKFNVHESLMLVDFFIRWLTNERLDNKCESKTMSSIEIRAFVLNLVEQIENLIQLYLPNEYGQLDSLILISNLEKALMINQDTTALGRVLYQTTVDANPNLSNSVHFQYHIQQLITEVIL